MRKILLITIAFVMAITASLSQRLNLDYSEKESLNFYKIQNMVYDEWKKVGDDNIKGFKQFKRWEYFWQQRTYPDGNFPEGIDIFDSYKNYESKVKDSELTLNVKWRSDGPYKEPAAPNGQQGIGRVNAIRFNPNNQNEIWIGSASGGLWKSNDYGKNWFTFPFTQFLSIGVSDIAIAPTNTNIVYVSTGDMFGSTSNRNFYSIGLIKSTDGGANWNVTNLSHKLEDRVLLGRVLVHPQNPNLLYVATSRGIHKSTDGGNNWKAFERNLHVMGMEFKPGDPNTIYASTYSHSGGTGVYVSYDAGETWERKLYLSNAIRIAIAVTPANPDKVYTLAAMTGTNGFHSVHQSDNSGETFEEKTTVSSLGRNILGWHTGNLNNDSRGQGFYDLCIIASPVKEDELYFGGINIWRTTDPSTSSSYVKVTHWTPSNNYPYVHADQHTFTFAPDNMTLFVGNDGGVDATTNRGSSWVSFSSGMNITQFYRIGVSQTTGSTVISGSQDNGTSLFKGNDNWSKVLASDGMEAIIDYTNANRMYASMYNGNIFRSTDGGQNFFNILNSNITDEAGAWVTPYVLNPKNPNTIYAGYRSVWRSNTSGSSGSWRKISDFSPSSTLEAIAVAPSDTNVIYASSLNQLFATYNGGKDWEMIHTSNTYITYIAVDFQNPRRIWLSKSGYNADEKVLELVNGEIVRNLTGNLPNVPVNTIVLQENSPDRLYIGTDIGIFYTDYNSYYWQRYGTDMPNVIVMELEIHKGEKRIYAGTYGRGLWSAPIIECNAVTPEIIVDEYSKFCPGDTITMRAKNIHPNYLWSNGATTREIKVTKPGFYSLAVIDNSGCIGRSEAYIVEKTPFDEMLINQIEDEFLCPGGELYLYASPGFDSYIWSNGGTDRITIVSEPGVYSVVGINPKGCTVASEEIYVDVKPLPDKPTISQDGPTLIASYGSAYQWYLDGRRIFNSTERKHTIQDGRIGEYSVRVFNEYGCFTDSDPYSIVTSVENNIYHDFDFIVSNNPGEGNFSFEFTQPIIGSISISVSDLSGRRLYSTDNNYASINNYLLDISHLASGIYIAKIQANNQIKTIKLVKN
ncbi:MAG: T9SS type A sorting domain-containing protein [Candidatus Kapabacteria bacterium]|nr:T9SS type A sorting domain-containing protein [Ignavibacteriota bacterium]MCW5883488.1 T9SS type A sorting domain-containing protein [Candidatus Kapabacteria bacterium]